MFHSCIREVPPETHIHIASSYVAGHVTDSHCPSSSADFGRRLSPVPPSCRFWKTQLHLCLVLLLQMYIVLCCFLGASGMGGARRPPLACVLREGDRYYNGRMESGQQRRNAGAPLSSSPGSIMYLIPHPWLFLPLSNDLRHDHSSGSPARAESTRSR